jgi:hypothetical protein
VPVLGSIAFDEDEDWMLEVELELDVVGVERAHFLFVFSCMVW